MRFVNIIISLAVAFVILFLLGNTVLSDLFWFGSIGYTSVYLTLLNTSVILFLIGGIFFFVFSYGNAIIAARLGSGPFGIEKSVLRLCGIGSLIAALIAGISISDSWSIVLGFINKSLFSVSDPIFGLDISFYIFELPFYSLVIQYLQVLFIFTTVLSTISYLLQIGNIRIDADGNFSFTSYEISVKPYWLDNFRRFLPHLNLLLFLIFSSIALSLYLNRYSLLFTSKGAVYGAGYTDVMVTIPVLTILSGVTFIIGLCFLLNEKIQKPEIIIYGIAAFFAVAIIGFIASGVMQVLVVGPNEFNLERPYLENNINSTLSAYGLSKVAAQEFVVDYNLTAANIKENNATISNIRLWDWRPMKSTIEQLQLFRTYYHFNDVDVDRYWINGSYKEVLISGREMDTQNLPSQAKTWVNQHLVYTHGYGAVMSPVDKVTQNGLPEFYLKDIPPTSPYLTLDQPRIYYGEGVADYVITNTETDEFDYPAGDQNIYTSYAGTGGVPLSDALRRWVFSLQYASIEMLVSGSLTSESRIHIHRDIMDRAYKIAPFLSYDPDPYLVVSEGRLYWIIDAYTQSDKYPYSEPTRSSTISFNSLNYVRNSVKVIIDAYSGDVTYYVVDSGDPIIKTYEKIFPELFREFDLIPGDLKKHLRYPHGLFQLQAEIYATYHMKDPRVFYNREDAWVIPDEVYRGTRQPMEPYYIIMKLPEEDKEEFILMLPFTPRNKENLIGWMAARCEPADYGDLIVYQFSKQELTYGPMQIEARIDQDPEISQRITLWSQSGSSVVRGNTLIIPVEHSLMYVEPLYLEATEKGTLPQLQRVIIAYSDRLTMQPTLSSALNEIFGTTNATKEVKKEISPGKVDLNIKGMIEQIAGLYDKAEKALVSGSLGEYQRYVDQIGELVKK